MTITAKVICDSLGLNGVRITTLELFYPRFIHAEFMTHRMFSRNASSSRAIPVEKVIESVAMDSAMPIHWGKNQKGMQAHEELSPAGADEARNAWLNAKEAAVSIASYMNKLGAHKQIVNRILEPFAHIRVIVTATEWDGFFRLRDHADAQPEIRELARQIKAAMKGSKPKQLGAGGWHLPYVDDAALEAANDYILHRVPFTDHGSHREAVLGVLLAVSAARCARVSYRLHDGRVPEIEADIKLAGDLGRDQHMSPFEHQATPCRCKKFHANFREFISHRMIMETNSGERDQDGALLSERQRQDYQDFDTVLNFMVPRGSGSGEDLLRRIFGPHADEMIKRGRG